MKTLNLHSLHRIFIVIALVILLGFAASVTAMLFTYGGLMTGVVHSSGQTDLLTRFNAARFETAGKRLELRQSLPDLDPAMRNPFGVRINVQPK